MHYADAFTCAIHFSEQCKMQQATRFLLKCIWEQMFMLIIVMTSYRKVLCTELFHGLYGYMREVHDMSTYYEARICPPISPYISPLKVHDGFRWNGAWDVHTKIRKIKIKFHLNLSENLYRKQIAVRCNQETTQKKLNFIWICPKIYTESK